MFETGEDGTSVITLTKLRELHLSNSSAPGRPLHLSAASGLVCVKSFLYVIADDELHLGVFRAGDLGPGQLVRLLDGVLPDPKPVRKKQKPDFEAITLLPGYGDFTYGALLVLGSGSTQNRRMGALLELDVEGAIGGSPRIVDFSPVFAPLEDAFPALNIEGAVVSGDELRLFQRGNKCHAENAIIRFQLSAVLDVLGSGRSVAIKPTAIHRLDLGQIGGIPFCFTDAAILPGGDMLFTAVAEDTDDAYNDGACMGAAIGIVDKDGHLRSLHRLDRPHKVEGVDARVDGTVISLLLVTDADEPNIAAGLFSATMNYANWSASR